MPDFRWFPNFPPFRDRQKPAPVPAQWQNHQHLNNPTGGFHGYHPSQAYPQSQYQLQQYYQAHNRHPRIPPQAQTSQPHSYPNPTSYYRRRDRHRHHQPQDNHESGVNTPANDSQSYFTPRSVSQRIATPFPSASSSQPQTPNDHPRRSHSQRSRVRAPSTSRTRPRSSSSSSNAPQIRSRMLDISLVHPLVCGHRHSLIPNQIPETEIGKPERSIWDSQNFSLPQGVQAPMMIDVLQVRSLSIDWDITLPPSFAKEIGRDGQVFTPPRHIHLPLIQAKFNSQVCIKTRQDNPLTKCFLRWGCIVVEPRDPNGIPPTMKQFLYDIWEYFRTKLTEEDCLLFSSDDLAKLHQMAENRAESYARMGGQRSPVARRGTKPTRQDVLWGYTRFAGLEVCPRFADTGDLFLYLERL